MTASHDATPDGFTYKDMVDMYQGLGLTFLSTMLAATIYSRTLLAISRERLPYELVVGVVVSREGPSYAGMSLWSR